MYLYTIKDNVSGEYTQPFSSKNQNTAVRDFKLATARLNPEDYSLYCVGAFDNQCGQLTALDSPEFIMNGVKEI